MISYKQWAHTHRTKLVTGTHFSWDLCHFNTYDHYITKRQAAYQWRAKEILQKNEIIVLLDFTQNYSFIIQDAIQQSGTKPNLVAKIWPPSLVTICAWLPKLVAKVCSQFHHLVNAGLVRFSCRRLQLMVAHTCKLDTIWVVCISPVGNGSILLWLLLTYCAQWSFTSNGVWHFTKLIGADTLKNYFFPALEVNFLKKLPQLLVPQMFQSSWGITEP